MQERIIPYLLIIGAAFCWGISGVFTKAITLYGYASMEMVFLKTLVGLIGLTIIGISKKGSIFKLERLSDLLNLAGMSILGYCLYSLGYIVTVNEMGAGIAAAMLYTKCVFVMIFSRVIFGKRITFLKLIVMGLTVLGCASISGVFSQTGNYITAKGVCWGILSGIGFALYDVLGKKSLDKYESETVTFYTFLIATIVVGLIAKPNVALGRMIETDTVILILSYGMMIAVLPYLLYVRGLSKIDVSVAAVISTFELLTAVLAETILYDEPLTIFKIMGVAAILGAVCLLNLSDGRDKGTSGREG